MNKYIGILVGLAFLSSCTSIDYPDRYKETSGVPTVHFVRYADKDVIISQAAMEETICIVGENLTSIHDIYFNDQKAVLNTSYMTAHTLVVAVPKTLPTLQDDKMHLITRDSSVVLYDFKVLPPAPKVETMSAEWAKPGEKVTIGGTYLFAPLTVQFPGADPIEVTSSNGTSIEITIPEGAQPGKVKVTTASGVGQSIFQYKDTRGMLFDFDSPRGTAGFNWHQPTIESSELSLDNQYLLLYSSDGLKADGSDWPDGGYHFEYWTGSWDDPEVFDNPEGIDLLKVVDFSDWKNMALKFEYMIPETDPWKGTPMQIWFAGKNLITWQTAGNEYFHDASISLPRVMWKPWLESGSYDTGGRWVTAVFPIASSFIYDWEGEEATGKLDTDSFSNMEIFIAHGKEEGSPSAPKIYIDNIRVVAIK